MARNARGAVVQWSEPGGAAHAATKYYPQEVEVGVWEMTTTDTGARWVETDPGIFEISASPAAGAVLAKATKRGEFVIIYD